MGFDPRWAERLGLPPREAVLEQVRQNGSPVSRLAKADDDVGPILWAVEQAGFGKPVPEHRFHGKRKWLFDFAWLDLKVALEREGSAWVNGRLVSRHRSEKGYASDCEKYNAAQISGWIVIRATPPMLSDGRALVALLEALSLRRDEPLPEPSPSGKATV